jgi:hypothetical protein
VNLRPAFRCDELDEQIRAVGVVDPRFGVSGAYLDAAAAAASVAAVRDQGRASPAAADRADPAVAH